MIEKRKAFEAPELEILKFTVEDVIATSSLDPDDEEWGAGEF